MSLYTVLTKHAAPWLEKLLDKRLARGKEDPERLNERKGIASQERPQTKLLWLHAASVGEAQSALILIKNILKTHKKLSILMTTGTVTSAKYLEKRLPERAFHQFYPLDHPDWVNRFLDHWSPDATLWMESELWPNMLGALKKRQIPTALINARMSQKSFLLWRLLPIMSKRLFNSFDLVLAQHQTALERLQKLGAPHAILSDNIKYSANALTHNNEDLKYLTAKINKRPIWLFASTHAGEEDMACRVHQILKNTYPELLTIIVPRHPERGSEIEALCQKYHLNPLLRGADKTPPEDATDIYISDTLGELGLFYRLSRLAVIGRSFSNDGGGGHNPIEAAQLNCAILHGPRVQYQQEIYDDLLKDGACFLASNEQILVKKIQQLLSDPTALRHLQNAGRDFTKDKRNVIQTIMDNLAPFLEKALAS